MPHHRPNRPRLPLAAALLLALGACQTGPDRADRPKLVEDFLGRVDQVRHEGELADQGIGRALDELAKLVAGDADTDAVVAFGDFVAAVEHSEHRAEQLDRARRSMDRAAVPLFARWEQDLEAFTSERLRERSRERLAATRARYRTLQQTVDPSLEHLQRLNRALRDLALFLSHDLNQNALHALDTEVLALQDEAAAASESLRTTRDAARAYIDASAPAGPEALAAPPGAAADAGSSER